MGQSWRCSRCGDVIGVYEPLVAANEGEAGTTSRAAEPTLDRERGVAYYHAACHDDLAAALADQVHE